MSELRIGSVVAGHEITRPLGAGAMGAVFEVRDLQTGARRALKTSASLGDPQDLDRAQREGEAMARLSHPNLLAVHAAGAIGGRSYLIMELAEGGSLGERLREGALDVGRAHALLFSLARALAVAHAAGVIHRDIKPDNVLFDAAGEPKLADFGLASLSDRSRLTETGTVLGTPVYMAPEQARGEQVGPSGDVYALGATIYRALSGRPPVESAGSLLATLARIQDEAPPPLKSLNHSCPGALSDLMAAMLRKNPSERPTAAGLVSREQSALAEGSGLRWALVGAGLVLALSVALVLRIGTPPPPSSETPSSSPPKTESPRAAAPAITHVASKGPLARQALKAYVEGEHCSSALRSAYAGASEDGRSVTELVASARDITGSRSDRLLAQVVLGTRGYLSWLEIALLPEERDTEDMRTLYLSLASLGCRAAAEDLGDRAGHDKRAVDAFADLARRLSDPSRFRPDPTWPLRLWLRAWPDRVPERKAAWWRAREALGNDPEGALAAYLEAFSQTKPGRERERLAVELHRVAEATWLRRWGSRPQRLIPAIRRVLGITEWGAGRLLLALAAWPSPDSTRVGEWRPLVGELTRALELEPDLWEASQRLATVHLRLGQPRAALEAARRVLLIYPECEVLDYALPVRVALEGARQDLNLVAEARLALAEFEGIGRVGKAPNMLKRFRSQLRSLERGSGAGERNSAEPRKTSAR